MSININVRTFTFFPTLATQSVWSNLTLRHTVVLNQLNILFLKCQRPLEQIYLFDSDVCEVSVREPRVRAAHPWVWRVRCKHKPPFRRPELLNRPGPGKEGSSSSNSGFPPMTVPVCLQRAVTLSPSQVALKTPSMPQENCLHQGLAAASL